MKPAILDELCRNALTQEIGLLVETNNPKHLKEQLAAFVKGVPEYSGLIVKQPGLPNTVFISKPSADLS